MDFLFKNIAEQYLTNNNLLFSFTPFPKASERASYDTLPSALKEYLLALGEKALGYEYPTLRATDYMAFLRTGNRVNFEDNYFARRHALNSLVVAECVENQGRFLDDIINGIFALCEESGWQLPAHNSKPGETNNLLPDTTEPVIDLFACETGAQLACILYLLEDQLNAVSTHITARIRYELNHRVITPYLTKHFWWMGSEEREMCNWTPWCTQNVLYTVFLCANCNTVDFRVAGKQTDTDTILHNVFIKAAASCDYFLKDYGEDGCCDEGAQYYRHAGLCLDGAASVLNTVSGGAFAELMQLNKIRNVAAYIYHVHVDDKYYFNFADCSPLAGRAGVREYLFGKHTCQPGLMQFGAEDFHTASDDIFSDESHKLNLFYRMQACFYYEEVMEYAELVVSPNRTGTLTIQNLHPDIFYPSVGLFLTRNDTLTLAVKAGDNADSHNHNDTGSITLYKHGKPILVDIGVESYTKKTFSPRRYEIWTMQSGYHNLPVIDGLDQQDGATFCATDVFTSTSESVSSISMEIATAYPFANKGLPERSYRRTVTFDKTNNTVTLADTTDSTDVILNFITYEKPELSGIFSSTGTRGNSNAANTITVGDATLLWKNADLLAIETLPITDRRLQSAWDHDLYRIRLHLNGPAFQMEIS